jgi:hypothetical protein
LLLQDVFSRFTLDSSTDFLFGNDVRSLSAGLIYPPGAGVHSSSGAAGHPANVFADAFLKAQAISASRVHLYDNWPLASFWKDDLTKELDTISEFIDPIVFKALEAKRGRGKTLDVDGDVTLLDQMVQLTDGTTVYVSRYLEFR